MGVIYIITLYNKPNYFELAAASVKAQTRECVHLAKQDEYQTGGLYPPAVYFNKTVKDLSMDSYIAWLSDDDLLLSNYAADLGGFLDTHPEIDAVYGTTEHQMFNIATGFTKHVRMLPQGGNYPVYTASLTPYCQIDGGQFMHRRSTLEKVIYPWYPETQNDCRKCDGTFAAKIAAACGIYPLTPMKQVAINRVTPQSGHVALVGDHIKTVAWTAQTGR